MADEAISTNPPIQPAELSGAEARIKQLSEKVRLTAEERDEKERLLKEGEAKNTELQRERDFFAGFTDVVAANPAAKDHKDDIKAKVLSGYTVEDATFAVLGKAGKLNQPMKVEEMQPITGGSAPTILPAGGGAKQPHEMTRDEKRAALIEAEKRGDLALN